MAKSRFELVVGVAFETTKSNTTDELPSEMREVSTAIQSALQARLSTGYKGSVQVWITSAEVSEA